MKQLLFAIFISLGMASGANAMSLTGEPTSKKDKNEQAAEADKAEEAAAPATPADPATPAEPAEPARVERPAPESRKGPPVTPAKVERSQFTTGIKGREPVDDVDAVDNTTSTVFYFTEIRDGRGQTITHEWWHDGEMIADVQFNVGGNRWRVWSSKDMMNEWTGEWSVRVVDESGNKLSEESFTYTSTPAIREEPAPADDADDGEEGQGDGRGMGDDRSDKRRPPQSASRMDTRKMKEDKDDAQEEAAGDEGDE